MIVPGESVAVSSIWVNRETRQRRELSDIDSLAESISKRGLIHPLVVTRELELIAGERRWTAVRQLGWTQVDIRYADTLDPLELQMIELEENIRRVNISWQEEAAAMKKWHDLRISVDPGWTIAATAEELNLPRQTVSEKISLAKEIEAGNATIAKQEKLGTAANMLRRKTERAAQTTLAVIEDRPAPKVPLLNADFHEWAAGYTGIKFNLIHCDFPYGIDANRQQQGVNVEAYGSYEDSKDVYFSLLSTLEMAMGTVVAEAAHLVFWFSMDYYEVTRERLTSMGWRVNPFPLVWHKSDNTGLLPDPQRGPRRTYETAFFASRGDRLIVQSVANSFSHPGRDKEIHMSEKPEEMLHHFLRMVCDGNSLVLDPTAGSGNAIKVAQRLGANHVLGIEKNEEFYARAVAAWDKPDSGGLDL